MEQDAYQTLWGNGTNSTTYVDICDNQANKHLTEIIITIIKKILFIYPWIMIIIGTTSNILSFVVFTRPKLKKSSTFFYLSCLCIVDLLTVYTFCINFISLYQFNIDIQLLNTVLCRVYSFLIYFLPQLSGWIVAAVSFDRVISITLSVSGNYTSIARRWNTPKIAARVVAIIFSVLFFLNMQFFFYPNEYVFPENQTIEDINIIYCSAENIPRYQNFYVIWVNIDLFVNVLIPFTIMIGSSLIIIISLVNSTKNLNKTISQDSKKKTKQKKATKSLKAKKEKKVSKQLDDARTCQINFNIEPDQCGSNQTIILPKKTKRVSTLSVSAKAKNVSSMLVTNNLIFITLTLPIVVFLSFTPPISDVCDLQKAQLLFFKVFFIILMNSNCTVNIFIYYFMSSQFKLELKSIMSFYKGYSSTTQASTNV